MTDMLQSSLTFTTTSSVLLELVVGLFCGTTASLGETAAAKFTVREISLQSSLLLDGVVDMLQRFLNFYNYAIGIVGTGGWVVR